MVDDNDLLREPACRGILQDYAQVMFWYRRTAEQGDAAAENNIGHMFEVSLGVTRHMQQAITAQAVIKAFAIAKHGTSKLG